MKVFGLYLFFYWSQADDFKCQDISLDQPGVNYRGSIDKTENGKKCHNWPLNWQHEHKNYVYNYCRNSEFKTKSLQKKNNRPEENYRTGAWCMTKLLQSEITEPSEFEWD